MRPKNVYLRVDGTAVIGDHAMITNWKTGYQRVADQQGDAYIVEEQVRGLALNIKKVKHDSYLADAFAAGLTLLEACNLKSCNGIYNMQLFRIDKTKLRNMIAEASGRYSSTLIHILEALLVVESQDRKSLFEILSPIDPYLPKAPAEVAHPESQNYNCESQ